MATLGAATLWTVLAMATSVNAAGPTPTVRGEVSYVHAEAVYLDRGTIHGVAPGAAVTVLAREQLRATLVVTAAAASSCTARVLSAVSTPRIGDQALIEVSTGWAPPEEPASRRADGTSDLDWTTVTSAGFPRIVYTQQRAPGAVIQRLRASAYLRAGAWIALDATPAQTFQQERLDIALHGPVDGAGRFWLDADMQVTGQHLAGDGARFRPEDQVRLDVYRATMSYRGPSLGVTLGRLPLAQLRYGTFDGAALRYELAQAAVLEVGAGLRPDSVTLAPGLDLPFASLQLSGGAEWNWGRGGYALGASWLGAAGGSTEGAESSLQLNVAIGPDLWLDATVGAFVLADGEGGASVTVDRLAIGGRRRILRYTTTRLSLRRWQDPPYLAEQQLLPSSYLSNDGTWDLYGAVDSRLWRSRQLTFEGTLAGGATWAPGGDQTRAWLAPAVSMVAPAWREARLRLGYRIELGWLQSQWLELGIGLRPLDRVRVDLWQQAGVIAISASGALLPIFATWVAARYRLLDDLDLGLRARSTYGDGGNGVEAHLWLLLAR